MYNTQYTRVVNGIRTIDNSLTPAQISMYSPSVYAADRALETTSEKYSFIPTSMVIETLQSNGWNPVSVSQNRTTKLERQGFQKHMIRFQNASLPSKIDGLKPEIVLTNAHDGSASFAFFAGLFRFICSNGLIIGNTFGAIKVRHIGFTTDKVLNAVNEISKGFDGVLNVVERTSARELTTSETYDFATKALNLKWNNKPAPLTAENVLWTRRAEDRGQSLFRVYNRVQENLVNGGLRGINHRRTRSIGSVSEELSLNTKLWNLASTYLN